MDTCCVLRDLPRLVTGILLLNAVWYSEGRVGFAGLLLKPSQRRSRSKSSVFHYENLTPLKELLDLEKNNQVSCSLLHDLVSWFKFLLTIPLHAAVLAAGAVWLTDAGAGFAVCSALLTAGVFCLLKAGSGSAFVELQPQKGFPTSSPGAELVLRF